jgi:hypothetical protein
MTLMRDKINHELAALASELVRYDSLSTFKKIKELLMLGASPHWQETSSAPSIYKLIQAQNKDGSLNALIEVFDEFTNHTDTDRELDSINEGMPLRKEEK